MNEQHILVIGAGGGIGHATAERFAQLFPNATIHALSRKTQQFELPNIAVHTLQTDNDEAIKQWCNSLNGIVFRYVVGAMGVLHGHHDDYELMPEKKLEELNEQQLLTYFRINSVVPSLWLKHLVRHVDKAASTVCFVSARVGSISDNRLGGWYGYRASKSALNMLIKTASIEYRRRTKHTALMSYHPGTVDTDLSKPFQSNVKEKKLFTPDFTAERLVNIMIEADVDGGPYYLDWDNKSIPW